MTLSPQSMTCQPEMERTVPFKRKGGGAKVINLQKGNAIGTNRKVEVG